MCTARDADKMVHRDNEFYADDKDQDNYLKTGTGIAPSRPRPNLITNGTGGGAGGGASTASAAAASATGGKLSSNALTTGDSKDFKSSLPGTAVPTGTPIAGSAGSSNSYSAPQMFGKKPPTPTAASAAGGAAGASGASGAALSSSIPKQSTSAPMDTQQ